MRVIKSYEAFDGSIFEDPESCAAHDKSVFAAESSRLFDNAKRIKLAKKYKEGSMYIGVISTCNHHIEPSEVYRAVRRDNELVLEVASDRDALPKHNLGGVFPYSDSFRDRLTFIGSWIQSCVALPCTIPMARFIDEVDLGFNLSQYVLYKISFNADLTTKERKAVYKHLVPEVIRKKYPYDGIMGEYVSMEERLSYIRDFDDDL